MKCKFFDLEALLKSIGLTDQECLMFSKAYTFPGLTPRMLAYQCSISRMTGYRVLERLGEKGLLVVREHHVYPISLHELSQRLTQISSNMLALAETFKSIEKLHAPGLLQHAGSIQLLKSDAALEAFDDMHRQKWEWNIALGDFECYGKKTDHQFNRKWIETFPEIGTTFIFSSNLTEDHTIAALKIQNKAVTDSYAQMVKAFLP